MDAVSSQSTWMNPATASATPSPRIATKYHISADHAPCFPLARQMSSAPPARSEHPKSDNPSNAHASTVDPGTNTQNSRVSLEVRSRKRKGTTVKRISPRLAPPPAAASRHAAAARGGDPRLHHLTEGSRLFRAIVPRDENQWNKMREFKDCPV